MGPCSVVVGDPGRDRIAGMCKVAEQRLVQKCVPHPAVAAFDETVLHRLSGRDPEANLGGRSSDRAEGYQVDRSELGRGGDDRRLWQAHALALGRLSLRAPADHPASDTVIAASGVMTSAGSRTSRATSPRSGRSRPTRSATSTWTSLRCRRLKATLLLARRRSYIGLRDHGSLIALIEAGETPALRARNPVTNRQQYQMDKSDIAAFHNRFVTLTTLVAETGLHRNALGAKLSHARVLRYSPNGRDFGAVYLRSDAEAALR